MTIRGIYDPQNVSDKSLGSRNCISVSFSIICMIITEMLTEKVFYHVILEEETLGTDFVSTFRACSIFSFSFYLHFNGPFEGVKN